jgi:hypothetical protein
MTTLTAVAADRRGRHAHPTPVAASDLVARYKELHNYWRLVELTEGFNLAVLEVTGARPETLAAMREIVSDAAGLAEGYRARLAEAQRAELASLTATRF